MKMEPIKRVTTKSVLDVSSSSVRHLTCSALFALCASLSTSAFAAGTNPTTPLSSLLSQCHAVTVPVSLVDGGPKNYSVSGSLCLPITGQASTVLLTVHGATYDHRYWDWPYEPELYSFRNFMTNAGYAVFLYDRIGDGQSSHPVSTDISVDSDGSVAHQIVQDLRTGQIDGYTFSHVAIVGHSLGSYTSWVEAGKYRDVDAAILTGIGHTLNSSVGNVMQNDIYPANQDPAFQSMGFDSGYLTTRPGTRFSVFYSAATTDPAVPKLDETIKQTVTSTEFNGIFATGPGSPNADSSLITAPVLLVNGQNDFAFCGTGSASCTTSSLESTEKPFYGDSPSVTSFVTPSSGHDINLEVTAPMWYTFALQWLIGTAHLLPGNLQP